MNARSRESVKSREGARRYACAVFVAAACAPLAIVSAAPSSAPAVTAHGAVAVTVTTDDRTRLLQPAYPVRWRRMRPGPETVWIDDRRTYQTVVGFGAAWTDSAAYLLGEVAHPAARRRAMRELFTRRDGGIGLNVMRVPIGSSDLARSHYSYDDRPAGEIDPTLAHFSIAHDRRDVLPLLRESRRLNPHLRLVASPWSPPGWMKTSDNLIGGSLRPRYAHAFAEYLAKFLRAYRRAGVPVQYLTLQNEPRYLPSDYPGMHMSPLEQRRLLAHDVLPALAASGLGTRVLVYDHNWDHPQYPLTVLSSAAVADSPRIAGIAWHGYGGTPGVQALLAARFPQLGQYETEHSGGTWVHDQVRSDFEEIIEVLRNSGRAYVKWSLALNQNLGPHDGGCGTCTPLVTVDTRTGEVHRDVEFATLGQFSRFIRPGARRVYSSDATGIESVAVINPDGSHVLVAFNDTARRNDFQVQWGALGFPYALPAYSAATFRWSGAVHSRSVLSARARLSAGSLVTSGGRRRADDLYSWGVVTRQLAGPSGGYALERAVDGDWAMFPALDFGTGVHRVTVRVACGKRSCGSLAVRLDSPQGRRVGRLTVGATGGWSRFVARSVAVHGARGVHNVYVLWQGRRIRARLATLASLRFR